MGFFVDITKKRSPNCFVLPTQSQSIERIEAVAIALILGFNFGLKIGFNYLSQF
ncbi:MAG: hypothetical protein QNJ72_17520 [Pleurocapsa sp. MO_226.B13]|nr:hypothetical protein [Pleurocapsa sp. MO_226.B13]